MSTGRTSSVRILAPLALAALMALAAPARAQQEPDTSAVPIPAPVAVPAPAAAETAPAALVAPPAPADDPLSIVALFPLRPESQVRRALSDAKDALSAAETLLGQARAREAQCAGREDVGKRELATAREQVKAAKKAKDTAALPALERLEKREELELDLLDRIHAVASAEVARGRALQAAASAAVRAYDLELDVTRRRASEPGAVARDLEVLALQAMKARGEKAADRERAEAELADRILRAYEARRRLDVK